MSTTLDTLLDEQLNEGKIVLTIDEPTRTLNYPSELILGVQGDYCAERIYFQAPQILHDDIDLTSPNIEIYIDYEDAYAEPHVEQCSAPTLQDDGTVMFSWLISDKVTEYKGTVKFNVCVKNIVDSKIQNEWHTTKFSGKVLDAVDVDNQTPETITSDSVTYHQFINELNEYENNLAIYTSAYNTWTETLKTYDQFIIDKIKEFDGIEYLGEFIEGETPSTTTPGVYIYNTETNYYILLVDKKDIYTTCQTIIGTSGTSIQHFSRSTENDGESWSEFTGGTLAYTEDIEVNYATTGELINAINDKDEQINEIIEACHAMEDDYTNKIAELNNTLIENTYYEHKICIYSNGVSYDTSTIVYFTLINTSADPIADIPALHTILSNKGATNKDKAVSATGMNNYRGGSKGFIYGLYVSTASTNSINVMYCPTSGENEYVGELYLGLHTSEFKVKDTVNPITIIK